MRAWADWPQVREVASATSGPKPVGVALRNWGPTRDVFVVWAEQEDIQAAEPDLLFEHRLYGQWHACDQPLCTSFSNAPSVVTMGAEIYGQNAMQHSLAVRRDGSAGPRLLEVVFKQKLQPDCNNADGTQFDGDVQDRDSLDLMAERWSTSAGLVQARFPSYNPVGVCESHGLTFTRFDGAVAHACYTKKYLHPAAQERVVCNDDDAPTHWGLWQNAVTLDPGGGDPDDVLADHPTFDVIGPGSARVVVSHRKIGEDPSAQHDILVHHPDDPVDPVDTSDTGDAEAPPPPPSIVFAATLDKVDHPFVTRSGLRVRVVHEDIDQSGPNNKIILQRCNLTPSVDCRDAADWLAPQVVVDTTSAFARSAGRPEYASDGLREFVVFQYNAASMGLPRFRVAVATRCAGDPAWTFEVVRTPTDADDDQYLDYGRPSMVLNQADRVAHVAFIEANNFTGSYPSMANADYSKVIWASTEYSPCL